MLSQDALQITSDLLHKVHQKATQVADVCHHPYHQQPKLRMMEQARGMAQHMGFPSSSTGSTDKQDTTNLFHSSKMANCEGA